MPFSGYLVYLGRFNLFLVATAGAVGCNLGSAVAYWIGAKGGRPLVERYGKWVLMSHHDLDRMTLVLREVRIDHGAAGAMLPVVQTFIAFPAGIARMPRLRFHIYTSVGSWSWYFCLAYVGMKLGEEWHTDPRFMRRSIAFIWWWRWRCWRDCVVCLVARASAAGSEGGLRLRDGDESWRAATSRYDGMRIEDQRQQERKDQEESNVEAKRQERPQAKVAPAKGQTGRDGGGPGRRGHHDDCGR